MIYVNLISYISYMSYVNHKKINHLWHQTIKQHSICKGKEYHFGIRKWF